MFDLSQNTVATTEEDKDFKGGGGFLWESNIHEVIVTMCYGIKKPSGSMCLHIEFENDDGKKYDEDFYFLSGKGRINYDAKDKQGNETGKTRYIPGYSRASNIVACAFAADYDTHMKSKADGVHLNTQHESFFQAALNSMEPKTVPVKTWDSVAQKMETIATDVDFVMTKLIGQRVKLGILKTLESKNVKNDQGVYVPTANTRDSNEVSTEFALNGFSADEIRGQNDEATMYEAWLKNNKDSISDKRAKQFRGTTPPAPGAAAGTAGAPSTPQPSLFGNPGSDNTPF